MKPLLTLLLLTLSLLANIPQSHDSSLLSNGSHAYLTDAIGRQTQITGMPPKP